MTDDEIRAAKALADAATPGKWECITSRDVFTAVVSPGVATIYIDCERDEDAAFIAAARSLVPQLADECLRLKALFREISEPDTDDPRLDYVTVQIGREAYREMMEARK